MDGNDVVASSPSPLPTEPPRILTSTVLNGRTVDVVEYVDGSLAILFDGAGMGCFHWGPGKVEACIDTYLRLIRN